MAQVLVNESSLEDIADAIRDKNGSSTTYQPAQMAAAIRSIPTGVTGVKGNAENSYRTGDVNLTLENMGVAIDTEQVSTTISAKSYRSIAVGFYANYVPFAVRFTDSLESSYHASLLVGCPVVNTDDPGVCHICLYNAANEAITLSGTLTVYWIKS